MFNDDDNNKASLSNAMEGMMRDVIVIEHKNSWNTLNNNSFLPFQVKR